MELSELKIRLGIAEDDSSNDKNLQLLLDDAIDFVNRVCNQDFLTLPPVAKSVVTKFVQEELSLNSGVVSESIGGMSQSFETKEQRDKALISMLRRAGLIRARFSVLGCR